MMTKSYKILAIDGAHFADYVMTEQAMQAHIASLTPEALAQASENDESERDSYILQMVDDIAVIGVKGRLTNSDSWINRYYGMLSYNEIRKASIQALDNGAQVVVYDYDTPGGSVDGMSDTGNLIASLGVPTISFTSSSMMSAGYFLGIQSDYVYADGFADVGSVGVIIKLYDRSQMLADMGVKPIRFRSGDLKASGDGDFKLSKKEETYIQGKVALTAEKFYNIVSDARGMSVESMGKLGILDGRTYIGEEALAVNLVDKIQTFDSSMLKAYDLVKKVDKSNGFGLL